MTTTYTWDVFSTLDGYGSYAEGGDWGGYWSKQGPELLEHRAALFDTEQRMVFGATTFRENAEILIAGIDPNTLDEWNVRTLRMPATVISSTLHDTLGWPDATIVERRRRRDRRPAQGGVGRAAALAGQPVAELGADGRRAGRPPAGDDLPGHLRPDRNQPDPRGARRLRPRAAREPDLRRPHPGARLPPYLAMRPDTRAGAGLDHLGGNVAKRPVGALAGVSQDVERLVPGQLATGHQHADGDADLPVALQGLKSAGSPCPARYWPRRRRAQWVARSLARSTSPSENASGVVEEKFSPAMVSLSSNRAAVAVSTNRELGR